MRFDWLITFRSVTFAQRGERTLQSVGIDCQLRRTPKELSARGCGYALGIRGADALAAVEVLRDRGVSFNKVFAPAAGGKMEERTL